MEGQDTADRAQGAVQVETEQSTEEGTRDTAKTLTLEEHEAQMSKMQSTFEKKAKQAEREAKEAKLERDSVRFEVSTLQEQLNSITAEIQRRELEGLSDLPEGQKVARLLETARRKEAELIAKEGNLKKMEATAKEGLKFKDALALSKEYDIDVDDLMECNTMADMYKTALQLTRDKIKTPEVKVPKVPAHIDSAVTSAAGKGRIWKASEIEHMSSDERFSRTAEIAKAMREGRIDQTK